MKRDEIPSLTDEEWYSKQELGKIETVLTYNTGGGTAQVRVVAHVLSGSVVESMTSKHTRLNTKTGEIELDTDAYIKDLIKQVFRLDEAKYRAIMDNKSSDLRMKLRDLATKVSGLELTEQEIEHEKNSESPEPSTTSLTE